MGEDDHHDNHDPHDHQQQQQQQQEQQSRASIGSSERRRSSNVSITTHTTTAQAATVAALEAAEKKKAAASCAANASSNIQQQRRRCNTQQLSQPAEQQVPQANIAAFEDDLMRTKYALMKKEDELQTAPARAVGGATSSDSDNGSSYQKKNANDQIKDQAKADTAAFVVASDGSALFAIGEELGEQQHQHQQRQEQVSRKAQNSATTARLPAQVLASETALMEKLCNAPTSNHNDLDALALFMPPTSLSHQTGRDTVPETQPGAVAVMPRQFANDPDFDPNSANNNNDDDDFEEYNANDFEEYNNNTNGNVSNDNSGDDSSTTPEVPSDDFLRAIMPEATPIRASIVRKEEESHDQFVALQQQMAAKQAEMVAMQTRLQDMERTQAELQTLKTTGVVHGVAVSIAEPVLASSAIRSSHQQDTAGRALKEQEKARKAAAVRRPQGMSEAELHAYQVLLGGGGSGANGEKQKKEKKEKEKLRQDKEKSIARQERRHFLSRKPKSSSTTTNSQRSFSTTSANSKSRHNSRAGDTNASMPSHSNNSITTSNNRSTTMAGAIRRSVGHESIEESSIGNRDEGVHSAVEHGNDMGAGATSSAGARPKNSSNDIVDPRPIGGVNKSQVVADAACCIIL